MRVVLATYGSRGDVEPMVALAVQLRALGAEVRVCAPPDEEFTELLARAGVSARAVREVVALVRAAQPTTAEERVVSVDEFVAEHNRRDPTTRSPRQPRDATCSWPAACCTFCRRGRWPTRRAIPLPVRGLQPESLFLLHRRSWNLLVPNLLEFFFFFFLKLLDPRSWNALVAPPITAHRASIGLPPVDDVHEFLFTEHPWVAADAALSPEREPGHPAVVRTAAWILPDDRPLPADLVAFLDAGRPPVYVGFGSMLVTRTTDAAQVALAAIRAQGRRAVLARGWADLAPTDQREDCFVVGEVNQQALFARTAAVIHHGGAGTTTTAARAGTPQVIVPQAADQPYWAARVTDLGIGAAHDGPTPTTASLSAALRSALTPDTRARATAIAATIRTDGAAVAAKLLVDTLNRAPAS